MHMPLLDRDPPITQTNWPTVFGSTVASDTIVSAPALAIPHGPATTPFLRFVFSRSSDLIIRIRDSAVDLDGLLARTTA